MFKYNEPCKTITGEIVTPYAKEGKLIACFDVSGKTVYKTIKDFSEKKYKKTIEAIPSQQEVIIQGKIADTVLQQLNDLTQQINNLAKKDKAEQEKITAASSATIKEKKIERNSETDRIIKKDTWKPEFNLNYKDNNIEE